MQIKLLIAVGEGKIFSLTLSQGLWVEDNAQAHWEIDCLINEAMQEALEEIDLESWLDSGYDDEYCEDFLENWVELAS